MGPGEAGNPWPKVAGFSALAFAVLVGGAVYVAAAIRPVPVQKPSKFTAFKASDGSFQCLYPQGWKQSGRSAQSVMSMATFSKEAAYLAVDADLQGALMGDIAKSGNAMLEGLPSMPGGPNMGAVAKKQKPVIETLHEMKKKSAEARLAAKGCADYQEAAAKPFTSRVGEARIAPFTANGGFVYGKVKGYRATMLGGERLFTVIAFAPERDWAAVDAAFKRMILSVTPGSGG